VRKVYDCRQEAAMAEEFFFATVARIDQVSGL
jgi:hypothetical protein